MSKRKRVIKCVAVSMLMIALLVLGSIVWLHGTVAPTDGIYVVTGLESGVTIQFDRYDRPFVQAATLNDALVAEGWLHAQHRFWQMEMFRRAGSGRLSELLGSSMLETDRELWRMGVPQLAEQLESNASEKMKAHVVAYVAGINAAIESETFRVPELLMLQRSPTSWAPRDVYALGALMAFQSANNSGNELLRFALINELGWERSTVFLPSNHDVDSFPYVIPDASSANLLETIDRLAATDPQQNQLMPRLAFGSNGWVIAPSKSESGKALFAFDSHDALGLPNLFYEVHLFFAEGKQIRGWSVAGLPGVINGYNERIAWGFTNIGDTQDLFLETRSTSDPLQFRHDGQWYTAETATIEIPVSGRDQPASLTITTTKNGPLISEDPPISISWTAQHLDGMGIENILEFNRALSCQAYVETLNRYAAPSLNATFADAEGNIGFRTAGLIPIRGKGEGLIPVDGSQPNNRWQGIVPAQLLPSLLNPDQGFLAAANARVSRKDEGPLVSADNAPGYRARRIQSVLSKTDRLTVDDMRDLQTDWYDGQAALLLPAMLGALEAAKLSPRSGEAVAMLRKWQGDYLADAHSAAAIVFQAWYRALALEMFSPGLSEELLDRLMQRNYLLNHALDRLILTDIDSDWWRGDQGAVLARALDSAVEEISSVQGDDPARWRLDRMHRVRLEHELGRAVPQLGWFFNAKPAPWGGGPATVGRARYRYDKAYDATGGATIRVVGEMHSSGLRMSAVISGGQSGHPLSKHYQDQFPIWLEKKLIPIADSPDKVAAKSVQQLVPQ